MAAAITTPYAHASHGTIRLIVPFAAGGPLDITARILAESVRDSLGTVIVENRAGAGGNIGVQEIARAKPDGLTIGLATTATHAINPWLYGKLPFDVATDFTPISPVARVPNVLVMNARKAEQYGIQTLADLIAYGKANPGRLNYGSGGNGSSGHLAGEMFKESTGIDAQHVAYRGASPAQQALLAGDVDFNIDNLSAATNNIKAGKLIALAVTTPQASPLLPGVPPLAHTIAGFAIDTWWGLVAPKGTPDDIVAKLNKAFTAALQSPQTVQRFQSLLAEPSASSAQQFGQMMQAERSKYQDIVKRSNARID